ncbi:MAG: hypothetical protein ACRDSP_26780 [Pseudonocardiaceae bacterium]
MTATNGHNAGHGTGPAVVTEARPIVLLRYRPGMAPESARVVHLVPLPPEGTGAVSALCGALIRPEEYETVTPGYGMPCSGCVISHVQRSDPAPLDTPEMTPVTGPAPDPTSPDTGPRAAMLGYRAWGWPVTLHGDHVWLSVDGDVVALLLPSLLAAEVTAILARRHCAPAVLAHPYAPQHRVLLCGERFGTALPWPPDVHHITGTLLLPPTVTPRGPLGWIHPPVPDSLRLCREIDIIAAVRVALRDPPPASGPMHF